VAGHRGGAGELTVRVVSGAAGRWSSLGKVRIAPRGEPGGRTFEVERSRSYRDRLVLKLREVDDANAAEALRGLWVWADADEVPPTPEGRASR
jgi:ribosomal 30S subunit maturation factor RimM